jgi:hypothetical protein
MEDPNVPADTEAGELTIEQRDGKAYVTTAPLPEHIEIARELWDGLEVWDPAIDADTGIEPPTGPLWLEVIGHADPEIDNDGYMLHVNTENVVCSYRAGAGLDGPQHAVRATLAAWGEK